VYSRGYQNKEVGPAIKALLSNIIIAILRGEDYRSYVLATINKRFLDNAHELLRKVHTAKVSAVGSDWWIEELLKKSTSADEAVWFGGLNKKTVRNMKGSAKKSVCIELGDENIHALQMLLDEFVTDSIPRIEISIDYEGQKVSLNEFESLLLMNSIAAMKLSIQGGAWSEVGKKTEKALLYTILRLLSVPRDQFILVFDEMRKTGFVEQREIDALIFSDDKSKTYQVELKLLGIGNPEIADEALARGVDLFLTDQLTEMMVGQAQERGITVIQFRGVDALKEIQNFLVARGVTATIPEKIELESRVNMLIEEYDEETERVRILQKAKSLMDNQS